MFSKNALTQFSSAPPDRPADLVATRTHDVLRLD